jgi:DeoR/GlpR family transcriptional regulator of sugar metabolism
MTTNVEEASLARINIKNSKKVFALIDSSKFLSKGITAIAPLSKVDTLITDSGIPDHILQEIRDLGVNVIIVVD